MTTFRATELVTGQSSEYEAAVPESQHLALIRNNDDALAMILIYWGFEDEA